MTNTQRTFTKLALPIVLTAFVTGCRSRGSSEDEVAYQRLPNYKYGELIVKDYDEMHAMVQAQIRKAQKAGAEGPAVEYLQNAMKLILSRPDSDNMVSKLSNEVRRELSGYAAFERVIAQLAAEAMDNIRNEENTVSVRTTSSFILENLIAEIRPEAEREPNELRKTVKRIADADVELPREVRTERVLRGMYRSANPGDEAQRIMKGIADREKAEKKKREEAERAEKRKRK